MPRKRRQDVRALVQVSLPLIDYSVARASIGQVVRVAQIGGAPLNESASPNAKAIGEAYLASVMGRAETPGVSIDKPTEEALAVLFGLSGGHANEDKPALSPTAASGPISLQAA